MIKKMHINNIPPSIFEEVKNQDGSITLYIGYSCPDYSSEDKTKMIIKRIYDDMNGTTTVQYAEGNLKFDKEWSARDRYEYKNLNMGD